MAFFDSSDLVINNYSNLIHKSFTQLSTSIQDTEVKILAPDGTDSDYFGRSVSVGSGRVVIGAYLDDDNGADSGSAHIYTIDGDYVTKITAPDGAAGDYFGHSVSSGSGRVVVGAYGDDSSKGSAYLFDINGNYITKILAPDGAAVDRFGWSVSAGSGRIAVGAYGDDSSKGSAYLFDINGNYITKILAPDGTDGDSFGISVSVGSGRIVFGAYLDDDNGTFSGSAYIYDLDGNYVAKILAPDGADSDQFGISVSVGSGKVVVGAYGDDTTRGSAHLFDIDGNYITKMLASDRISGDYFGWSVSAGSGRIVVGAREDDDNGTNSGSSYIYDLNGNYIAKLLASDGALGDRFGYSVSVGTGKIVVGSYFDDDNGPSSGSAYIYTLDETYDTYIERILGK